LLNRVAQLYNLVSKPELNGQFVMVESFDSGSRRYAVRILPLPNSSSTSVVRILVKPSSFVLSDSISFEECYPMAPVCRPETHDFPPHSITQLPTNITNSSDPRSITPYGYSRNIRGVPVPLGDDGLPAPATTMRCTFVIAAASEGEVFEFEDLCFEPCAESTGPQIYCTCGSLIVFRRCVFRGAPVLVAGRDIGTDCLSQVFLRIPRSMDWRGTPKVTFENCLFENCSTMGVVVGNDGEVTLINCTARNCMYGLAAGEGGRATVKHSAFMNNKAACKMFRKALCLDMLNCSLTDNVEYGVYSMGCGRIIMRGCRVARCPNSGISVFGRNKHVDCVLIDDCAVLGCDNGIGLYSGDFSARISGTVLSGNECGLHFGMATLGTVHVLNCSQVENDGDILKLCGDGCKVIVDGVEHEHTDLFGSSTRAVMHISTNLAGQRAYKRAGFDSVKCSKCGAAEPPEIEFKKCGMCKAVWYCGRECQKEDWKLHKVICTQQL